MLCNAYDDMSSFSILNTRGVTSSDYLSLARDRKYITVLLSLEKYKWWNGKMVTGQGYGLGIGGCKRLCPAANGV